MSMNDGIQEWWAGVPIATRYLFSSSAILTLTANFGFLPVMKLLWAPKAIYQGFEIWRLVTPFLYMGGMGFNMLIGLVFLLRYSQQLEQGRFLGRLADYVFLLSFGAVLLMVAATILEARIMSDGLIMLLIYVWCRTNPNVDMSFLFGIRFKSGYFPWVLIAFKVLLGGSPFMDLAGCLIGHLYIYLKDIYPQISQRHLLNTPQFLVNLIPHGAGINQAGGPQQPHLRVQPQHPWGTGNRLGGH